MPVKPAPEGPHPLSGVIRAYTPQNPAPHGRKARGAGNGLGKGGKGDVGELRTTAPAKRRTWELLEQRRIVLREASKAWQQRTAKNYGGEVAYYFAERVSVDRSSCMAWVLNTMLSRRANCRRRHRRSS